MVTGMCVREGWGEGEREEIEREIYREERGIKRETEK